MKSILSKSLFLNSLVLFIVFCLSACGFHLRGKADIPFDTIYIIGNTLVISKQLNNTFALNEVEILDSADNADLQLDLLGEENEKRILSIGADGTVNEFELYYRVHYRSRLAGQPLWGEVQTVEARRDFTFSESNRLAKGEEERQLNKNMYEDVVGSIVRRLSATARQSQR